MMDSHTKRRAGRVCVVAVFTLLLVLFLSVNFDFYYDLNDDTMIKDILSGAYTGKPNGFCIQMLYPLGWFIALFYRAIPTVAWYGLFLCVCQFGVLALAALRLMRSTGTKLMALAAEAAIALGLFLREFVIIQYSVTAGICMAGAVFLFLTAPEEEKPSVKQGKRREKNAVVPDLSQTFDERMKRFLHYMEFKRMDERWIETAEGELRIVIDALADYHDIASKKTEAMEMGYVRAVWEDRLERIKKIQTKLEESVGYVRDKQLEICRKRKPKRNDDIGEDAMLLAVKGK